MMSNSSSNTRITGATVAVLAAGTTVMGIYLGMWIETRRRRTYPYSSQAHRTSLTPEAKEIYLHMMETQIPARLLGIHVWDYSDTGTTALSLAAPLHLNRNVHNTAFAGSLYSLGALCSYYLGRAWCRKQQLMEYTIVAKSWDYPIQASRHVWLYRCDQCLAERRDVGAISKDSGSIRQGVYGYSRCHSSE